MMISIPHSRIIIAFCTLVFLLVNPVLQAQDNDFGFWTTISFEKNLKKWQLEAEGELRTFENAGRINRWSLKAESSYNLLKPIKTGLGYQFISFNDTLYRDFQPRHRIYYFIQGKLKVADFTFSVRERFQLTTKDESDRIKESGKIDTYKINPELVLRSQAKIAYDIPKFPVNPTFSFEAFYSLNDSNGNAFNELRYTISLNYKLNKHHEFELYALLDRDINVKDPVKIYIIGFQYLISL
jgi:hypothetical protein